MSGPGSLAALRRATAVNLGVGAGILSRALGKGGGTTVPGYLAERLDPGLLGDLARALPGGCAVVSGTNGKTTTSRILADALRLEGYQPIANREGSNMSRGLVTTLIGVSDRWGRPRFNDRSIGVFELDEGTLPQVVAVVAPRAVVLTNLLRDQLDRYFELDFLRHLWATGLRQLPPSATLVVNADDPHLAYLAKELPTRALTFGLADPNHLRPMMEHASDARRCPGCEHPLEYRGTFYAHLGHYSCPACGWARPRPDVVATGVELGPESSRFQVDKGDQSPLQLQVPLAGLHNVYNALAALAGAKALGVSESAVVAAAASVQGAFGRAERLRLRDRDVVLALAKNPSGFNATLRWLGGAGYGSHLLLALNDAGPDGRDVSWIWDVDFEGLPRPEQVTCAGTRALDLALRVEYAGLGAPSVEEDPTAALWSFLDRVPERGRLAIVATYTAMWSLRQDLVRQGHLPEFWADPGGPAGRGAGTGT
jgi:UDP-N-acetylmuramyl tripeptide synthase